MDVTHNVQTYSVHNYYTYIEQLTERDDNSTVLLVVSDLVDDFAQLSNLFENFPLRFLAAEICFRAGLRASIVRIILVDDLKPW